MANQAKTRGAKLNETGLSHYQAWELDKAIEALRSAVSAAPNNPEYHLNLVRAYARNGDYDEAMKALGEYLRIETEQDIAARYEQLFSSALDEVEQVMIDTMREMEMPIQQIGKGIQMWLEYRITIGRRPLRISKPAIWAAALTYAVIKVNFVNIKKHEIAKIFKVSERALSEKYNELVETLDIMPADYRYFTGEENPLDKLVEAAQILEQLDRRFQEE